MNFAAGDGNRKDDVTPLPQDRVGSRKNGERPKPLPARCHDSRAYIERDSEIRMLACAADTNLPDCALTWFRNLELGPAHEALRNAWRHYFGGPRLVVSMGSVVKTDT